MMLFPILRIIRSGKDHIIELDWRIFDRRGRTLLSGNDEVYWDSTQDGEVIPGFYAFHLVYKTVGGVRVALSWNFFCFRMQRISMISK